MRLARSCPILPSDVHGKLADKNKFGLAPVGAGPYRVQSVDQNKGVVLVRNKDYSYASEHLPQPTIGHIVAPVPPKPCRHSTRVIDGGRW